MSLGDFSSLVDRKYFEIVHKSRPHKGWYERISQCSENEKDYLIEYCFHDEVWLSFNLKANNKLVYYAQKKSVSQETIDVISKGAVLKLWFQINQIYALHASGIRVGSEIILFVGPKGAGKSTTAAYFGLMGYPIWCDDYCVLEKREGQFFAFPGESSVKVKNDTIEGLSLPTCHIKSLYLPEPEIESLTIPVDTFKLLYRNNVDLVGRIPLKVRSVYFLNGRGVETVIRPYNVVESLKMLMKEIMIPEVVSKEYRSYYFSESIKFLNETESYEVHASNNLREMQVLFKSILGRK